MTSRSNTGRPNSCDEILVSSLDSLDCRGFVKVFIENQFARDPGEVHVACGHMIMLFELWMTILAQSILQYCCFVEESIMILAWIGGITRSN
jgi:hypothetical protein